MSRVFGRIGLMSFGGPAAQISLMYDVLVRHYEWLSDQEYLRALSLCMLLPGPEAMQLATYAGWRLRGVVGGLLAGLLFIFPGTIIIFLIALGYIFFGDLPVIQAAFLGVKSTVAVIVLQAVFRLKDTALTGKTSWILACTSFIIIFVFGLPFPLIVFFAGCYGYLSSQNSNPLPLPAIRVLPVSTICFWVGLWILPLVILWFFDHEFLFGIGIFFSKLSIVTFGGAYAVLAYMAQEVVQSYGWVTAGQMIDALGLAETTPGPLILVIEFVALLAGFTEGGISVAILSGLIALWVTFTPCFLWIFVAGPYLDVIASQPRLLAALNAIAASVVGVILNLSVWFILYVLFTDIHQIDGIALPLPDVQTFNLSALYFIGLAMVLMLKFRVNLILTMMILATTGCTLSLLGFI